MSVPKSKRSTPKCNAVLSAKKLAEHTLKITANKNVFKVESLTNDINHLAERVYISAYSANNIYVNDHMTYEERMRYQLDAIIAVKDLLALIDMSWHMEHLKGSKVEFWISLALDARKVISAWSKSDKERYKQYK